MLTTSVIYTTYWYIQHIGIYNILVYATYWYIQHIGIYNILVFTTYWYLQQRSITIKDNQKSVNISLFLQLKLTHPMNFYQYQI